MLDAALFGLPKLKMKVQGDPENKGHIFPKKGGCRRHVCASCLRTRVKGEPFVVKVLN